MLCLWFSALLLCHNYYLHVQDIFPCSASDNSWKNKLTSQISINQCHWISCKWGLTIVHLKVKGRMLYKVYKPRVYLHNIELTLKCLINVGWFTDWESNILYLLLNYFCIPISFIKKGSTSKQRIIIGPILPYKY